MSVVRWARFGISDRGIIANLRRTIFEKEKSLLSGLCLVCLAVHPGNLPALQGVHLCEVFR